MKKYILLLLGMILLTVSCGQESAVKKTFEEYMKVIQSGDVEKLKKFDPTLERIDVDKAKFMFEGFKKITYKVNKVEAKGNTAVVNATVKSPNFGAYMNEFQNMLIEKYKSVNITDRAQAEKITADEAEKFFGEKIKNNKLEYIEKTIDIKMDKKGSKWDIDGKKNFELISLLALGLNKQK